MRLIYLATPLFALVLASCDSADRIAATDTPSPAPMKSAEQQQRERLMLDIAREYRKFGAIDDEARWAPGLCRAPMAPSARFSHSDDASTHGGKLYLLYAMDASAYAGISGLPKSFFSGVNPFESCRQIVVKESWSPQPLASDARLSYDGSATTQPVRVRPAERDGLRYVPGQQRDLFIMAQLKDEKAPDTDAGWIYSTVTPDGKTVTSIGRVESCMACHVEAPHGRLFGLAH